MTTIKNKLLLLSSLLFSVSAGAITPEYEDTEMEMIAIKISNHSFYIKGNAGAATDSSGFISNSGFVITSEGVVVFDALGTPSLAQQMLLEIKKVTNKPIKILISSHYHADHIYGIQVFKEAGAEIWAPKGTMDYLDSEVSESLLESRRNSLYPWVNEDTYLVSPDKIIDKDTTFSLGGQKFLLNYFGKVHSAGDMSLYFEDEKVLFSGDIIFEGRIPYVGDANIIKWIETLKRMKDVKPKYFVPGHGTASNNAIKTMELTSKYLDFLFSKFLPAVDDMAEFDETYNSIDWSDWESLPAFKEANRKNAMSVFLFLERNI